MATAVTGEEVGVFLACELDAALSCPPLGRDVHHGALATQVLKRFAQEQCRIPRHMEELTCRHEEADRLAAPDGAAVQPLARHIHQEQGLWSRVRLPWAERD